MSSSPSPRMEDALKRNELSLIQLVGRERVSVGRNSVPSEESASGERSSGGRERALNTVEF